MAHGEVTTKRLPDVRDSIKSFDGIIFFISSFLYEREGRPMRDCESNSVPFMDSGRIGQRLTTNRCYIFVTSGEQMIPLT